MGIYNLCLVDRSGKLLFSYYLLSACIADQDAWEAELAVNTNVFWEACFKQDCPTAIGDKFVVLRGKNDVIFILSGVDDHDELALVDMMDYAVSCVTATCDGKLSPANVISNHGKLCVCVQEMFFGGELVHDDVETVLRNAKFKPPKV